MVELALILPFLLLMLVGIIDFGEAWALKDQLTSAARDGARVAVADFNDTTNPQLCGTTPCSVQAAASALVTSLTNSNVDTCGLNPSSTLPALTAPFTWTYTSNNCASSGLPWTITMNRALVCPGTTTVTTSGGTVTPAIALCTMITVSYPYNWNFASVFGLQGGTNFLGNTITLNSVATMTNLN